MTRGPGTALYGSDAIGGIINMLTLSPAADASLRATTEAGSFGRVRALIDGNSGAGHWGALHADIDAHTVGAKPRSPPRTQH